MAFAVAIPRFRPRDTSLPPPAPGSRNSSLEGFDLVSSPEAVVELPGDRHAITGALARIREWLEAGVRVYGLDLDLLLAQYLWFAPTDPTGLIFRQAARDGRLCSLPHLERNLGLLGLPGSQMMWPASQGSSPGDWWKSARWMDRWLESNGADARTSWGPLASGLDLLGDAAVRCMSWKGLNTDADYLRASLRAVGGEALPPMEDIPAELVQQLTRRESVRTSLLQAAQALREDGRMHPVYERQRLGRLMALNPTYHSFSSDTEPSSRRVVIPDPGDKLVSMDVSMAELFVAGVLWKQRLRGPKAGRLLADLLDPAIDIHHNTGQILFEEAGLVSGDTERLRSAGKVINFGLGNMAGQQALATNLQDVIGAEVSVQAISRTQTRLARRYPLEEWQEFNKDLAFRAKLPRVRALSGRLLFLPAKAEQRKPSLSRAASYQTQTTYADMHQAGLLAVVSHASRTGAWPIATLFDELVLTVRDPAVMPEVRDIYLQAAQEVSGEPGLRLKWTVWGGGWGVP